MSGESTEKPVVIRTITPPVGLPGGEVTLFCDGLDPLALDDESLHFCGSVAMIEGASPQKLVTHIPENTWTNEVSIIQHGVESPEYRFIVPRCVANALHCVTSPAVTKTNEVLATFCGMPGQLAPVSVFLINSHHGKQPFSAGLHNIGAVTVDGQGQVWAVSRSDGYVCLLEPEGAFRIVREGFEIPCALAACGDDIYLAETGGKVFLVQADGSSRLLAELPPSDVSLHLAVSRDGQLFASSTQRIGENVIWTIGKDGHVREFARAMMEFHGIGFDATNALYVAVTERGSGGIDMYHLHSRERQRIVSGQDIVGMAFDGHNDMYISTISRIYLVHNRHLMMAWNAVRKK